MKQTHNELLDSSSSWEKKIDKYTLYMFYMRRNVNKNNGN